MLVSRHQVKVFFSSATIAAALLYSLFLGTTNAEDLTTTRVGDNIYIQGNSWAENRFRIGEILGGDMDNVVINNTTSTSAHAETNNTTINVSTNTNTNATVNTTDMSTAEILDVLLGDNPEPKQPVTTVWQEATGAHLLTGIDDIEFSPAYIRAREHGITTVPFSRSNLDRPILRYEFAKMMLAYIQNVEGKTLADNVQCNASNYADYHAMDASVKTIVQQACEVGLMGWRSHVGVNQTITVPLSRFRPYDVMPESEINIVATRYVPTTIRLMPTNNTRSAVIRFLYSISPQGPDQQ